MAVPLKSRKGSFGQTKTIFRFLLLSVALCLLLSCTEIKNSLGQEPAGPPAITGVRIEGDNKIIFEGNAPLNARAVALPFPEGTLRAGKLIVDIPDLKLAEGLEGSPLGGGGLIGPLSLKTNYKENHYAVRAEASLNKNVDVQTRTEGNVFTVTLLPRPEMKTAEPAPGVPVPSITPPPQPAAEPIIAQAPEPLPAVQPIEPSEITPAPTYTPPAPAPTVSDSQAIVVYAPPDVIPTATRILDVMNRVEEDNLQVLIKTDGVLGQYKYFILSDPPRLVVDLPGIRLGIKNTQFPVNMMGLTAVRLGDHPDMSRVVLDFNGPLPKFSLDLAKQGLIINMAP